MPRLVKTEIYNDLRLRIVCKFLNCSSFRVLNNFKIVLCYIFKLGSLLPKYQPENLKVLVQPYNKAYI